MGLVPKRVPADIRRMTVTQACALLAGAALLIVACRKDPAVPGDGGGASPTPLRVALPAWVLDSIGPMPVPPDNPLTVEGVALGRKLFYEPKLSDNGTLSCGTCHVQASAFSDPRRASIGTNGAMGTRNAMAIVNLAWSQHFFWDGRRPTLEAQAHDPVTNPIEMRNEWPTVVARLQADPAYPPLFKAAFGTDGIDSTRALKAIAQFERTLVSFGSRFDRFYYGGDTSALTTQEKLGFAEFTGEGFCSRCHTLGLFTDDHLRNNGIDPVPVDSGLGAITQVPADIGRFKVPTLRNIDASTPYMHDGRFESTQDVVQFYDDHIQLATPHVDPFLVVLQHQHGTLDETEQAALIAFLSTLTDNAFLTDPAFGAP